MLDGFNEGWIDFEQGEAGSLKGNVALETVLNALIKRGGSEFETVLRSEIGQVMICDLIVCASVACKRRKVIRDSIGVS